MIISKSKIIAAMKNALPGIDSISLVEGADTFIFRKGFIHSYNDSISVTTPFDVDGAEFVVKAKDFYSLINKMKEDTINLELEENSVVLKCGKAKASFVLMKDTLSPTISSLNEEQNNWEPLPDDFKNCLMKCIIKGNKYSIAGIFVSDSIMYSTDGMRINSFPMKSKVKKFWISDSSADNIMKIGDFKEYSLAKNWVHFKDKNNIILSCRKLPDEKYPESSFVNIILSHKKDEKDLSNKLPEGFIEALNRASSLSMSLSIYNAIELTFTKEGVEIFSERTSGSYSEKLPWEKPFEEEFDPIKVYVDSSMIENGLFYSKEFYLKSIRGKGGIKTRIVFGGEDGMHLLGTIDKEA